MFNYCHVIVYVQIEEYNMFKLNIIINVYIVYVSCLLRDS